MIVTLDFDGPLMTPQDLQCLEKWARSVHDMRIRRHTFREDGVEGYVVATYRVRSSGFFISGYLFAARLIRERGRTVVLFLVELEKTEGPISNDIGLPSSREQDLVRLLERTGLADVFF